MMPTSSSIPTIDIRGLFGPASAERDALDDTIMAAAAGAGVMTITGFPEDIDGSAAMRCRLLRLFDAPRSIVQALACNRHDPSHPPVLHGWFDVREGRAFYYEGMEIGPDVAYGRSAVDLADPLRGPTPMPSESDLPGWRSAVRNYYLGMERAADAVMRSIERGLGITDERLSGLFVAGESALRLLRYPVRSPASRAGVSDEEGLYVFHDGIRREVISEAHFDFGFITRLAQDDVGGLQAKLPCGSWIDVPPVEGHLVVNFGKLLECWTASRIRATEHRVLSSGRERFSVPFFFSPRVDAEIKPLSSSDADQFASFLYGDHAWASLPKVRRLFGERVSKKLQR